MSPQKIPFRFIALPSNAMFTAITALCLTACGGGSSSSGITFGGVAATGAAFGGATVTATDAAGASGTCSATDATTGAYSCNFPVTAQAPFVIEAKRMEPNGATTAYYSVAPDAQTPTVHVTKLTTAIVAGLSPTGDPAAFKTEVKTAPTIATANEISKQIAVLKTNLQSVIDASGTTTFSPLSDPTFSAGTGKGLDKVLDMVSVDTTPQLSDGTKPSISLALSANPEAVIKLSRGATTDAGPTVTGTISTAQVTSAQTILGDNPSALIADLLKRMNTCYALPVATRVAKTDGTGVATDVQAPECKTLFTQDDPSKYKSGGNLVSAKSAFKPLFYDAATGTTLDQGNFEYARSTPNNAATDGNWVVSYRATDKAGNVSYGTFAVAKEGTAAVPVLKLIGNQYDHDTSVSAYVQDREFINDAAYSFLSTGYVMTVNDKIVSGASVYQKVVVTAPSGKTFTLKPLTGCSYLGLVNSGNNVICSNTVRLSYAYTKGSPAGTTNASIPTNNPSLVFAAPALTDAQLLDLPNQGVWTFDITLANGNTVQQKNRTLSRAPTLAAVQTMAFAQPTDVSRTDLTTTQSLGYRLFTDSGVIEFNQGTNGELDWWTVPAGAIAPTTVRAWGNAPKVGTSAVWGNGFDDSTTVLSTARKAILYCSRQTTADLHCDSAVAVGGTGNYAVGVRINEAQLSGSTAKGLVVAKHIALYQGHSQ